MRWKFIQISTSVFFNFIWSIYGKVLVRIDRNDYWSNVSLKNIKMSKEESVLYPFALHCCAEFSDGQDIRIDMVYLHICDRLWISSVNSPGNFPLWEVPVEPCLRHQPCVTGFHVGQTWWRQKWVIKICLRILTGNRNTQLRLHITYVDHTSKNTLTRDCFNTSGPKSVGGPIWNLGSAFKDSVVLHLPLQI